MKKLQESINGAVDFADRDCGAKADGHRGQEWKGTIGENAGRMEK